MTFCSNWIGKGVSRGRIIALGANGISGFHPLLAWAMLQTGFSCRPTSFRHTCLEYSSKPLNRPESCFTWANLLIEFPRSSSRLERVCLSRKPRFHRAIWQVILTATLDSLSREIKLRKSVARVRGATNINLRSPSARITIQIVLIRHLWFASCRSKMSFDRLRQGISIVSGEEFRSSPARNFDRLRRGIRGIRNRFSSTGTQRQCQ